MKQKRNELCITCKWINLTIKKKTMLDLKSTCLGLLFHFIAQRVYNLVPVSFSQAHLFFSMSQKQELLARIKLSKQASPIFFPIALIMLTCSRKVWESSHTGSVMKMGQI